MPDSVTRRRTLAALAALGAARALPAAAQPAVPAGITIIVPTTAETLPLFWAQQQGLFAKAGIALNMQPATSGSAAATAVIGGAADIGSSNVLSVMQAHAKGLPLVLLCAAGQYDDKLPNNEIFVPANSPIKTAKDLEGKNVAIASLHDLLALSMKTWMDKEGVDVTKVHFVEIPPSAQVAALQSGRVDSIHVYEPFRGQAERAGFRAIVAPYYTIGKDFVFSGWFANLGWASAHRELALKFAQIMHDASLYTNAHYDELIPVIASYTKMTPEDIKAMRKVRTAPNLTPGELQPLIDVAAKFHELDRPFPASEIIFPGVP